MSYDISLHVRVHGAPEIYALVAEPECASPTYNLGRMFRACMNWNYSQSEPNEAGEFKTVYYPCSQVIKYVETGICNLRLHRKDYEKYNPENGFGSIDTAIEALESLRQCIYETAETIPIECLYMKW